MLFGMVCSLCIILFLITSGCVETVNDAKGKKLVDRVGNLVVVEAVAGYPDSYYICIIDEDGVIYYPEDLNAQFKDFRDLIINDQVNLLHENNVTKIPIIFSAKKIDDVDMSGKIGNPVHLSKLECLGPYPNRNVVKISEMIESSVNE